LGEHFPVSLIHLLINETANSSPIPGTINEKREIEDHLIYFNRSHPIFLFALTVLRTSGEKALPKIAFSIFNLTHALAFFSALFLSSYKPEIQNMASKN